jgi:hypothetical protein
MKQVLITLAIAATAWLAWQAWQPPESIFTQSAVRSSVPENKHTGPEMWRIVTKRMVWKQAIASLRDRLYKEGFETQLIVKQEPIELHAFDDPRVFKTSQEAEVARVEWKQKKIDAAVLKREITFIVSLGRFYLTSYAEQMQERLKRIGKPYRYERRTVTIPAYRFVFNTMEKAAATKSWQRLQNLGIADPVMMREAEYQKVYGKKPA